MPVGAAIAKLAATRGYGADVELVGETLDECAGRAPGLRRPDRGGAGAPVRPPRRRRAGRAPSGWRSSSRCPDVATVVVAAGGGGLLSGVAAAVRALRPDVRIVGVQAEQARRLAALAGRRAGRSAARGCRPWPTASRSGEPAALTFAHVAELVDEIVTVSEDQLSRAMLLCLERAKLVVEPAGAAAVAAIMADPSCSRRRWSRCCPAATSTRWCCCTSPSTGWWRPAGSCRCGSRSPTGPGSLAALLAWSASSGGNVVDVEHSRLGSRCRSATSRSHLRLETEGPEHCASVGRSTGARSGCRTA